MRDPNTEVLARGEDAALRCAHHVPGRLRLKAAVSKGTQAALRTICCRVDAIAGITAAISNPISGSVIAVYDPRALPPPAIEERLRALELLAREPERAPGTGGTWGDRLAEAVVRKLVAYAVEALTFAALDAL